MGLTRKGMSVPEQVFDLQGKLTAADQQAEAARGNRSYHTLASQPHDPGDAADLTSWGN
jgi:hypothetical protein